MGRAGEGPLTSGVGSEVPLRRRHLSGDLRGLGFRICFVFPGCIGQLEWSPGSPLLAVWPRAIQRASGSSVWRGEVTHDGRCPIAQLVVIVVRMTYVSLHWEFSGLEGTACTVIPLREP